MDEALIAEFRETPLHTLDDVLQERRERNERDERVRGRAKELLDEELEKRRQAKELRELEEAITASQAPAPDQTAASHKERGRPSAPAAAPASAPAADGEAAGELSATTLAAAVATAPFELEGAGRSVGLRPYVANLTDFVAEGEASRVVRELRAESDLLRKCLADGKDRPRAFDTYLKASKSMTRAAPPL